MPRPAELAGQRVLVLGLGAFGGGAGCARELVRAGARVTATDLRPAAELPEALAALAGLPVELALGGHSEALFAEADWVVVNPAVPEASPWLGVARRCGCRLTTDVNLAVAAAADVPALAVTGTHGKSTTAALASHLLGGRFRTALGGNLGGSLLETVHGLRPADRLAVELSSYQTERLEAPPPWPAVAALTGLGSDHLDRHGDREGYAAAKRRLLGFQDGSGVALLPHGDPEAGRWREAARGRLIWFAGGPLPAEKEGWEVREGALWERRNQGKTMLARQNAFPFREPFRWGGLSAAVGAARLLGLSAEAVEPALASFPGLPHRMERLPAPAGRIYVDNAVATHPEPTVAALAALGDGVVLVAGGKDKGLPLDELAAAAEGCRALHLFGEGGRRLAEDPRLEKARVTVHPDARNAIQSALEDSGEGETLLFSPSFASYDEFRNFRDRARLFRELCAESSRGREIPTRDAESSTY